MNAEGSAVSRSYRRIVNRRGGPLPTHRATARLSAYVYGNILTLAAVVVATPETIADGHAALLVLFTGLTTYISHVFAEFVAHSSTSTTGVHMGEELADARPIASSATIPAIALALGWLGWIPTHWAFFVAGGVVVLRIASIQVIVQRVRGNPLTPLVFIAGLATAAIAAVIVVLKVVLTH